ncbi:hypothetical protein MLD38_036738 [Melastoma candidum]|uniref:Uncharacterized protein n=1 Tax=Melastoma candidum TaxID=119954 RepID=A0ACB9LK47_9MYRT|nr:hypothetical protein MLD38_036738 [Melastoma candidum]
MRVLGPLLGCNDLDMSSSVDDSLDRPIMSRLRSEEERERRRMRDRERRRSMTSEQKERHLARRRRNYQLRMQRVKNHDLVTNANPGSGINGLNHRRAGGGFDPMSSLQFGCYAPVGSGQALLKVHGEYSSRPEGKESLAYDLTKLQRRLRLIHVKHFARSLKRPLGELMVNNVPILADLIMKGNQVSCCKSVHGVRLNRIKQLARGHRIAPEETSEHLPFRRKFREESSASGEATTEGC